MARWADIVVDQTGTAIAGAFITVLDDSGAIASITDDTGNSKANPITADGNGAYYFNASSGIYTLQFRLNLTDSPVKIRTIDLIQTVDSTVSVKDFGAVGNGVTDDSAAFVAAIAYLKSIAGNSANGGMYVASPRLFIPAGNYWLNTTTLDIEHTLIIEGDGGQGFGDGGGAATMLRWAAGTTGIRIEANNTANASDVVASHTSGAFTTLRRLYLLGPAVGGLLSAASLLEGEYHGLHVKATCFLEDVQIEGFQGDALYAHTSIGAGSPDEGFSNNSSATRCQFRNSRNGASIKGGDANVWLFSHCQFNYNRACGVDEEGFLGNTYISCHTTGNGISADNTGSANFPAHVVNQSNFRFCSVQGQETGASTNAPTNATVTISIASPAAVTWNAHGLSNGAVILFNTTGALPTGLVAGTVYYVVSATTNTFEVASVPNGTPINTSGTQSGTQTAASDNAYWYLLSIGASATGIPAWTSGISVRCGAPYRTNNVNGENIFINPYTEGGQGFSQFVKPTLCIGGLHAPGAPKGTGAYVRSNNGFYTVDNLAINSWLAHSGILGFFGTNATTQKTVTGSRGGNAALASLITQLASYGLVVDGSTA
jgi:hypothetical protein